MPRSHRIDIANGLHHVTQRGLERRNIVLDDDDRSHWWRLFERVARRCQWRVFAVALLDNHFHIYLRTPEPNLSVKSESQATRELYGAGQFSDACLVARRMVERGVRMVQLYYGGGQPWDDHGDIMNHANHAKQSDQAIAGLIRDLKSRGLFDETLIVWGGEFGRTPWSQGAKGRDHHSRGFTIWMAGGGIKPGITHGETDDFSYNVVRDPVHVHDLNATILHQLGIDHKQLTFKFQGRHYRLTDVHGEVVQNVLA